MLVQKNRDIGKLSSSYRFMQNKMFESESTERGIFMGNTSENREKRQLVSQSGEAGHIRLGVLAHVDAAEGYKRCNRIIAYGAR